MNFSQSNRFVHRWGSIIVLIPAGVIILSGLVLQLKKQSAWIQPPTQKGSTGELSLGFDQILAATQQVPETVASMQGIAVQWLQKTQPVRPAYFYSKTKK